MLPEDFCPKTFTEDSARRLCQRTLPAGFVWRLCLQVLLVARLPPLSPLLLLALLIGGALPPCHPPPPPLLPPERFRQFGQSELAACGFSWRFGFDAHRWSQPRAEGTAAVQETPSPNLRDTVKRKPSLASQLTFSFVIVIFFHFVYVRGMEY